MAPRGEGWRPASRQRRLHQSEEWRAKESKPSLPEGQKTARQRRGRLEEKKPDARPLGPSAAASCQRSRRTRTRAESRMRRKGLRLRAPGDPMGVGAGGRKGADTELKDKDSQHKRNQNKCNALRVIN